MQLNNMDCTGRRSNNAERDSDLGEDLLYEINDDPKRKEFLDDLFSFMQKRGTPINRLPIMAKSVLDLYELYNLVIARGGLVDVINKKLWQEIIKGLHLPSSITSAAFTLRTQYMKYLYPYECDKKNLSTPNELQAAIDGNRREGRRSSYGQYEAMHSQIQMPQIGRQALPAGMQQMTPLALVTHAANNHQAQAAAAAAAAHHRLMAPTFGQMPSLVTQELEHRMMEYLKIMQVKSEQQNSSALAAGAAADIASRVAGAVGVGVGGGGGGGGGSSSGGGGSIVGGGAGGINAGGGHAAAVGHSQQQRQHSQSPDLNAREALNAFDISRVALWQFYHNNTSPPRSMNVSPLAGGGGVSAAALVEQHSEALNLSDSPPTVTNIKRERDREASPDANDRDDFHHQPPPVKRVGTGLNFPAGFYLPPGMAAAAAAAAANFHQHKSKNHTQDSDVDDEESDAQNITMNSSTHEDGDGDVDGEQDRAAVNGHHHLHHHHHHHHQHNNSHHHLQNSLHLHSSNGNNTSGSHDKSDDSAIENSPSTSAASGSGSGVAVGGGGNGNGAGGDGGSSSGGNVVTGSGHISPVSTKKIHLSKPQNNYGNNSGGGGGGGATTSGAGRAATATGATLGDMDALSLLTGMQFRVARNGTGANGESQLIVNLELNGMKYSGVLIANTTTTADTTLRMDVSDGIESSDSANNSSNNNIKSNSNSSTSQSVSISASHSNNNNNNLNVKDTDVTTEDEDIADAASTTSTEDTPTKTKNGTTTVAPALTNGPAAATLKDSIMTS